MRECYTIKNLIREKHETRVAEGNTTKVFRMHVQITEAVEGLRVKEAEAARALAKQQKTSCLFADMETKKSTLHTLRQQAEQCRRLVYSDIMPATEIQNATDFVTQMEGANVPPPKGVPAWRDANDEENDLLGRWARRDADIDAQIMKVGGAVDQLNDMVHVIQQKADQQKDQLADLNYQTEHANETLIKANGKLKSLLDAGVGRSYLIPKIVLTSMLAIWAAWIWMLVSERL